MRTFISTPHTCACLPIPYLRTSQVHLSGASFMASLSNLSQAAPTRLCPNVFYPLPPLSTHPTRRCPPCPPPQAHDSAPGAVLYDPPSCPSPPSCRGRPTDAWCPLKPPLGLSATCQPHARPSRSVSDGHGPRGDQPGWS